MINVLFLRNDPTQDKERNGRLEQVEGLRGCTTNVRENKANGRPISSESCQTEARTQGMYHTLSISVQTSFGWSRAQMMKCIVNYVLHSRMMRLPMLPSY